MSIPYHSFLHHSPPLTLPLQAPSLTARRPVAVEDAQLARTSKSSLLSPASSRIPVLLRALRQGPGVGGGSAGGSAGGGAGGSAGGAGASANASSGRDEGKGAGATGQDQFQIQMREAPLLSMAAVECMAAVVCPPGECACDGGVVGAGWLLLGFVIADRECELRLTSTPTHATHRLPHPLTSSLSLSLTHPHPHSLTGSSTTPSSLLTDSLAHSHHHSHSHCHSHHHSHITHPHSLTPIHPHSLTGSSTTPPPLLTDSLTHVASLGRPLFALFAHPAARVAQGAALLMRSVAEVGAAAADPMREAALREGAFLAHLLTAGEAGGGVGLVGGGGGVGSSGGAGSSVGVVDGSNAPSTSHLLSPTSLALSSPPLISSTAIVMTHSHPPLPSPPLVPHITITITPYHYH